MLVTFLLPPPSIYPCSGNLQAKEAVEQAKWAGVPEWNLREGEEGSLGSCRGIRGAESKGGDGKECQIGGYAIMEDNKNENNESHFFFQHTLQ